MENILVYKPRRGSIAEMVLAVKSANPDLSPSEVQKVVSLRHPAGSVSLSHVQRTLDLGNVRQRIQRIPARNNDAIKQRFQDFLDTVFD